MHLKRKNGSGYLEEASNLSRFLVSFLLVLNLDLRLDHITLVDIVLASSNQSCRDGKDNMVINTYLKRRTYNLFIYNNQINQHCVKSVKEFSFTYNVKSASELF